MWCNEHVGITPCISMLCCGKNMYSKALARKSSDHRNSITPSFRELSRIFILHRTKEHGNNDLLHWWLSFKKKACRHLIGSKKSSIYFHEILHLYLTLKLCITIARKLIYIYIYIRYNVYVCKGLISIHLYTGQVWQHWDTNLACILKQTCMWHANYTHPELVFNP